MEKFRKKPVVIEAIQFFYGNENSKHQLNEFCGSHITANSDVGDILMDIHNNIPTTLYCKTLEGDMKISHGDFIIKGVNGEFYPCKPEIFEKTYEKDSGPGSVSDGYHTFDELYLYRLLYNAAFFNELAKAGEVKVCKSHRHSSGEECFGGGWFIVMAELPTGQISNHYEDKDWDLFNIPELEFAWEWDGHTPNDAADRLKKFIELKKKKNV